MMNMDQARAGDGMKGILSPPKPKTEKKDPDVSDVPGPTEPVFSSEEQKLNIEIPSGWKIAGN